MITIPTLAQLYADIKADLESEMDVTLNVFGKVFLVGMAAVQAGKLKLYYLAIGNLQKNIFVDTAEPESIGGTMERFGRVKLNRNPFSAVAGQYEVTVTGTAGAVIRAQITFKSNDNSTSPGKLYVLDSEHTMVSTSDTITLRALESGVDSKLSVGDELTATEPIINVSKIATVSAETVEPLAAETTEEYRATTLEAYRLEPQGGAGSDYRLWSKDAQGVKQSYPYAKSGAANEINLFVEATIADSIDNKGTPSAGMLAEVEEVVEFDPDTTRPLEERGRRPLGVFQIHFLPVTVKEVDINIANSVGFTTAIRTAITNALEDAINNIRPFVASVDILEDKNDILDTNKIIAEVLNVRPGAVFGTVTLSIDGAPVSTYTFSDGNIPHLNSVTFV